MVNWFLRLILNYGNHRLTIGLRDTVVIFDSNNTDRDKRVRIRINPLGGADVKIYINMTIFIKDMLDFKRIFLTELIRKLWMIEY